MNVVGNDGPAAASRNAPARPRFLLVSNVPPIPLTSGSRQRTHHLLQALRALGTVDLLLITWRGCCSEADLSELRYNHGLIGYVECHLPVSELRARLRRRFPMLEPTPDESYAPYPDAMAAIDRAVAHHEYNAIVGRYLLPAARARLDRYHPVLVDLDDVEYGIWESRMTAPGISLGGRLFARLQRRRLRRITQSLLPAYAHVWLAGDVPEDLPQRTRASRLPNVPIPPRRAPSPSHPAARSLMIVGSMVYRPNAEGARRFVERIWPRVRNACPDAVLRIVGRGLPDVGLSRSLEGQGVRCDGQLDDLDSAYAECALVAAPIYFGSGTKIKVLEALAHGRTCVVTPHALAGLGHVLRHGDAVWCGANDEEMARGCIRLLKDGAARHEMESRGRKLVHEHYNIPRFHHAVRETVSAHVRTDCHLQLRSALHGSEIERRKSKSHPTRTAPAP